jgi:uncharacterized damage-inducible protein DinB
MIEQGERLLSLLSPDVFTARSSATLGASIGGHLRHNLDHYACFLRGVGQGRIDYDERERAPDIETEPTAAMAALRRAARGLQAVPATQLEAAVEVRMDTGESEERPWTRSTVRRELQFLLSHTVHHYALIAMICHRHDVPVHEDFGVAPSTIKHRRRAAAACAR